MTTPAGYFSRRVGFHICHMPKPVEIRDRIRELRRVKASALIANPQNWRRHPTRQKEAVKGLLHEIGYAGALAGARDA
jgi:hypothetical protein